MRNDKKQSNSNPGTTSKDFHSPTGSPEQHITQDGGSDAEPRDALNPPDRLHQFDAEKAASQERRLRALTETEKQLLRSRERYGVNKLNPFGLGFDPNFHQAVVETRKPNILHRTVALPTETGQTIATRPMRHAKVGVSRDGPSRKPKGRDGAFYTFKLPPLSQSRASATASSTFVLV